MLLETRNLLELKPGFNQSIKYIEESSREIMRASYDDGVWGDLSHHKYRNCADLTRICIAISISISSQLLFPIQTLLVYTSTLSSHVNINHSIPHWQEKLTPNTLSLLQLFKFLLETENNYDGKLYSPWIFKLKLLSPASLWVSPQTQSEQGW